MQASTPPEKNPFITGPVRVEPIASNDLELRSLINKQADRVGYVADQTLFKEITKINHELISKYPFFLTIVKNSKEDDPLQIFYLLADSLHFIAKLYSVNQSPPDGADPEKRLRWECQNLLSLSKNVDKLIPTFRWRWDNHLIRENPDMALQIANALPLLIRRNEAFVRIVDALIEMPDIDPVRGEWARRAARMIKGEDLKSLVLERMVTAFILSPIKSLIAKKNYTAALDLALKIHDPDIKSQWFYGIFASMVDEGLLSHAVEVAQKISFPFFRMKAIREFLQKFDPFDKVIFQSVVQLVPHLPNNAYKSYAFLTIINFLFKLEKQDDVIRLLPTITPESIKGEICESVFDSFFVARDYEYATRVANIHPDPAKKTILLQKIRALHPKPEKIP